MSYLLGISTSNIVILVVLIRPRRANNNYFGYNNVIVISTANCRGRFKTKQEADSFKIPANMP